VVKIECVSHIFSCTLLPRPPELLVVVVVASLSSFCGMTVCMEAATGGIVVEAAVMALLDSGGGGCRGHDSRPVAPQYRGCGFFVFLFFSKTLCRERNSTHD
jgi:hypothetical protein